MRGRTWQAVLARHGQAVTLYPKAGAEGIPVRAFVQPLRERGQEQTVPSPLGLRREERYLYLGPAEQPLAARETVVEWAGRAFEVQNAHVIRQPGLCHWWAVLRPREEET